MSESAEPIARDEASLEREDQATRQALIEQVVSSFEAQNPSEEIVAFVRRLVQYCAKHGPRVDIRFRATMARTSPDIDDRLRDDPHYTSVDMLPQQYFTGKYVIAREQRLGPRLRARLQEAFPRALVKFELGERIEESRDVTERLPPVEVPTLFVDYTTSLYSKSLYGIQLGRQRKGKFVNVRMVFLASFRIPGESASLDRRIDMPNEPTSTLIDLSPSPQALYETLATGPYNAFAWQFPNWFLKGPLKFGASKPADDAPDKVPAEPFEPDPRYLDPTHDEPIRFSEVGPRCGRADANCLPIPYNGDPKLVVGAILKSRYQPKAKRTTVPEYTAAPGAERCSHDGDCLAGGGGRCVRWDTELPDEFTLKGLPLFDAYCGCVQKQCQWFTQPRPTIHLDFKSVKLDGWPKRLAVDQSELDLTMDSDFKQEVGRCFVDHLKQLPRRVVLSVEQRRDRTQQTGSVSGVPGKVARCIEQMFPSMSVSLQDVTDAELAQRPITLTATFVVSVKTDP